MFLSVLVRLRALYSHVVFVGEIFPIRGPQINDKQLCWQRRDSVVILNSCQFPTALCNHSSGFFFVDSKEVLHNVAKEAANLLVSGGLMILCAHGDKRAELIPPTSQGRGLGD